MYLYIFSDFSVYNVKIFLMLDDTYKIIRNRVTQSPKGLSSTDIGRTISTLKRKDFSDPSKELQTLYYYPLNLDQNKLLNLKNSSDLKDSMQLDFIEMNVETFNSIEKKLKQFLSTEEISQEINLEEFKNRLTSFFDSSVEEIEEIEEIDWRLYFETLLREKKELLKNTNNLNNNERTILEKDLNELESFSKRSNLTVKEIEMLGKYLNLIKIPEETFYKFSNQNVNITYQLFELLFLSITSSLLKINYKYVAKYKIFYTLLFLTGSKITDLAELTKSDLETIILTKRFYWKNYKIDFNETEVEFLLRIENEINRICKFSLVLI